MPAPYPPLSEEQKKFIEAHHDRMSIREMAKRQHTCLQKVRDYLVANSLPFRAAPGKKNGGKRQVVSDSKYFDYRVFSNWLV